MLRILSWNILQGGGSRIQGILKAIKSSESHIVILSEFHNNKSGMLIRNQMLNLGYWYQFTTGEQTAANTVAIFSKIPCNSTLFPSCDENFPHAILKVDFEMFDVIGVYYPHKKKHKLLPFVTELLRDGKPAIVAGDYNTGKNYIDQKGNSFWYTEELEEFEDSGYIDAFRHIHGETKEFSWYSHQGNGFRYDHTYVHDGLKPLVKDCYYFHEWRESKLSDHSAMVLELA